MYLDRKHLKNPPLLVKAWMLVVKTLTSLRIIGHESKPGHPMLYSYQGALPTMPIPSVKDTLRRSVSLFS